ncbi:MAG: hypothetical protein FD126_3676, partial [Elusimicrobia bacterium]
MRAIFMGALCALLFASPSSAADGAPAEAPTAWASMKRWLETMKKGLMTSAVEQNYQRRRGVVAVAAVRGEGQGLDDPGKPYWKGTTASKEEKQAGKERAELGAAVELALTGKRQQALQALSEFESAHPDSALSASAREARERLRAAESEPPALAVEAA